MRGVAAFEERERGMSFLVVDDVVAVLTIFAIVLYFLPGFYTFTELFCFEEIFGLTFRATITATVLHCLFIQSHCQNKKKSCFRRLVAGPSVLCVNKNISPNKMLMHFQASKPRLVIKLYFMCFLEFYSVTEFK